MKKIIILLLIVWMGFIFYNSSRPGVISQGTSERIVNELNRGKNIIEGKGFSQSNLNFLGPRAEALNYFVRKNAHAFEYLVLAILVAILLSYFGLKGTGSIIYIMFICLMYAVLDEFHQSFVLERTSLVSDVLIDFSGAIIGMILYFFTVRALKKIK